MISNVYEIWAEPQIGYVRTTNSEALDVLDKLLDGVHPPRGTRLGLKLPEQGRRDPGIEADVLHVTYGTLLLAEDAIVILEPMLSKAGYFIDVDLRTERQYRLFVCDNQVDAFDTARTIANPLPSGNFLEVYRYEFLPDRLPSTAIFKLNRLRATLFASDRFVNAVSSHKMVGFTCKHVWNHETGGIHDSHEPKYESYPGETANEEKALRRAARAALAARGPLTRVTP